MTPNTDALPPLLPCPMCGEARGYILSEGSTYRWWDVSCAACGREIGECASDRRTHLGGILPDRWEAADEAWNDAAAYAESLRASLAAQQGAQVPQGADAESRAMFVARLENMQENGDHWLTVASVLALLNDCDYLASRSSSPQAPAQREPLTDEQIDGLRGLDTASRVRFYEHDFYVLSNFSAFNLRWKGNTFPTSEHAYHWEKFAGYWDATNAAGNIATQVLNAPSAHEAFKIAEGCKARRRPDWDDVKVGIMLDILRAKADQHEYVRRKLLATGDRELVEDSWRDDFWGWGPNRDGMNMLGKLWMQVRAELRGITKEHP